MKELFFLLYIFIPLHNQIHFAALIRSSTFRLKEKLEKVCPSVSLVDRGSWSEETKHFRFLYTVSQRWWSVLVSSGVLLSCGTSYKPAFHPHPLTLLWQSRRTLVISFRFVLIYGFSSKGFVFPPVMSAIQLGGRWVSQRRGHG